MKSHKVAKNEDQAVYLVGVDKDDAGDETIRAALAILESRIRNA